MSSSYKLFNLNPDNFSWQQLKFNYKKLAIQNHPDKGGDPDFFNFITAQFQKLALEIKNKNDNHNHFHLKQNYDNSSLPNQFSTIHTEDKSFNSKFNTKFDANKFIEDDIEFGYGDIMTKSTKVREDFNIQNIFGKSKVTNLKFNETFENKIPTTNVIQFKEPEALPSSTNIIHSEIGTKTTDYSGKTCNNSLQYTDFKVAYTEERVPSLDNNRRKFKNVKEYQQYSDKKLKESFSDKELHYAKKNSDFEKQTETQRLHRLKETDDKIDAYYLKINRLNLQNI